MFEYVKETESLCAKHCVGHEAEAVRRSIAQIVVFGEDVSADTKPAATALGLHRIATLLREHTDLYDGRRRPINYHARWAALHAAADLLDGVADVFTPFDELFKDQE